MYLTRRGRKTFHAVIKHDLPILLQSLERNITEVGFHIMAKPPSLVSEKVKKSYFRLFQAECEDRANIIQGLNRNMYQSGKHSSNSPTCSQLLHDLFSTIKYRNYSFARIYVHFLEGHSISCRQLKHSCVIKETYN